LHSYPFHSDRDEYCDSASGGAARMPWSALVAAAGGRCRGDSLRYGSAVAACYKVLQFTVP